MQPIELFGGAFTAELIKGKDGRQSWKYTPRLSLIGKKKEVEGSMKEKPQFAMQIDIEQAAVKRYQTVLRDQAIDIVKYLNTLL